VAELLNAQMQAGVEEAERRKIEADNLLERLKS
jgi:hypothetical protein